MRLRLRQVCGGRPIPAARKRPSSCSAGESHSLDWIVTATMAGGVGWDDIGVHVTPAEVLQCLWPAPATDMPELMGSCGPGQEPAGKVDTFDASALPTVPSVCRCRASRRTTPRSARRGIGHAAGLVSPLDPGAAPGRHLASGAGGAYASVGCAMGATIIAVHQDVLSG